MDKSFLSKIETFVINKLSQFKIHICPQINVVKKLDESIPSKIETFIIKKSIFKKSIAELQRIGLDNKEGIVYWIGDLKENVVKITDVIFAANYSGFENYTCYAKVPLTSSFEIAKTIRKSKKILFMQVHSHPGKAFHSITDDKHPITHRIGLISIVVPYFGSGVIDLSTCEIYEYKGNSNWDKIIDNEKLQRFILE